MAGSPLLQGSQILSERLETLRHLRGPAVEDFTGRVREVVILASSSRGGSSMLAELLRRSPDLLHLRAEINPFLRLVDLTYPDSADSDRLDAWHLDRLDARSRRILDVELALDAGRSASLVADDDHYLLDSAWRFAIQWPAIDFHLADWLAEGRRVLARLREEGGWAPGELRDPARFQLALSRAFDANPWYYDMPRSLLHDEVPELGRHGAPGDVLVEEPPFVLTQVWQRATEVEIETKPLVIKTPSNAYRLPFLRALFPRARLRVIHLTRNPAASINGLLDGWHYHGFHAHRMVDPLDIEGYHDRWWWKFDLPPGWQELRKAPLAEVCAFQWRSAHQAILDDLEEGGLDSLRMRFEDLVTSAESRVACLARLTEWLGVPFDGPLLTAAWEGIDSVVATAPPAPGRWRTRWDTIKSALDDATRATATRMGYESEDDWL
ncbi:sulfotransferase [Nonomuraea sp. SYSU D8015]|uniref:sulfotransferase n=1 Tax=Nonomuraea sp. SYSU D8015 TaxID=2593644 RepID=UPI0016609F28|nr:sulfotransferase [Nonomuraea sp. SYSU D8015]